MRFPKPTLPAVVSAVALACATPAQAQQVFVANSSNGRITVFEASGASSPFPGDTSSLVTPLGITLDGAGRLIVCDNQRGRILRYGADGSGPTVLASRMVRPDGPSLGPGGDLFFVTSPDGESESKERDVYVLPGGSGTPVRIATIGESSLLRDTAVVPSGPFAGQVLVLSSKPGFVARLRKTAPTTFVREPDFAPALPGEPTGMAFTPSGDLLVSGIEGVVRRLDASGSPQADFASGLGVGATRITVGSDGTVYVTNRNGPTLFRFNAAGTQLSSFGGSLQSPAGVATQEFAPTPVGQNVTVTPLPGVTLTYDNVVQAGFTSAARSFLEAGQFQTPCGNFIPEFATPPAGDTAFVVTLIETTAGITDSIELELLHPDANSRVLHAACPPDEEGFEDVTTLLVPGDPRGRIPTLSEFVVVTDTRPLGDVIQFKLADLMATLDTGSQAALHLDDETLMTLRDAGRRAAEAIALGDEATAIEELQGMKGFVRAGSGTTIPNSESSPGGNVAGILESEIATLIFSLSLVPGD